MLKTFVLFAFLVNVNSNMMYRADSGGAAGSFGSPNNPYTAKRSTKSLEHVISQIEEIFWEYAKTDPGVQEGIKHLNSCSWLKLIRKLEHHNKFKKLKVLLAKNDIMDLSYKKLVPIKSIMLHANLSSHATAGVTPDFSNLMLAIEAKMDEIPALTIYLYNVYHSQISKRIQESSTAGVIQHFLDDIMTLPVTDLILHELLSMSFNFNSVLHLIFATISYYDNIRSQNVKEPTIKDIAKYMDDGTLLANIIKENEVLKY